MACSFRNVDDNFAWALVSTAVVCNLWVCLHVNLCDLGMIGAYGGIMVMWDIRVVEKTE